MGSYINVDGRLCVKHSNSLCEICEKTCQEQVSRRLRHHLSNLSTLAHIKPRILTPTAPQPL